MKSGRKEPLKPHARKNPSIFIILLIVLAGGGAGWYFLAGPGAASRAVDAGSAEKTYTTAVARGDLRISAAGSGKLVAYQSVDLSFPISGSVAELNVANGDMVRKGQVLAKLGASQALEASLAQADVQVMDAQKTLDALKAGGELALAQARSDQSAAQDTYDAAVEHSQQVTRQRCSQNTNTRYKAALDMAAKRLSSIHAETKNSDVYIAAKKDYDTAFANYTYCIAFTPDEKASAASALEVAKAALETAQQKYATLKASAGIDPGALAMAEAKVEEARAVKEKVQETLDGITLTAPMDGRVTYLTSGAGTMVGTSTYITVTDVSRAALEINVDESDAQKLVIGSPVTVAFDALPGQAFTGKVVQVDPQVTRSGEYTVAKGVVELDAAAVKTVMNLPLGLSASVTVVNQESKGVLLAPTMALKDLGDGSYGVMVQDAAGKLRLRVVTIGIQDKDYTEINGGLKEGDLVSTGTKQFLAAGSNISSDTLKNAQNQGVFPGGPGRGPLP